MKPVCASINLPHTRKRESQAITPDNATAAIADHTIFKIFLISKPFVDITFVVSQCFARRGKYWLLVFVIGFQVFVPSGLLIFLKHLNLKCNAYLGFPYIK